MAQDKEDQWDRMRNVLSQMSQDNSARLLPWFLSTAANPSAGAIHSLSEAHAIVVQTRAGAPANDTTPKFKGSQAPIVMSSPTHPGSTPPPLVLSMSDIPAAITPVGQSFFMLPVSPKHKKWGHFANDAPDGHRARGSALGPRKPMKQGAA